MIQYKKKRASDRKPFYPLNGRSVGGSRRVGPKSVDPIICPYDNFPKIKFKFMGTEMHIRKIVVF